MAVDISKGYVDAKVDTSLDLIKEIKRLKKEKGAVILAHYYQPSEIQDLADFIGDSLALAQIAEKLTDARLVVMCGVNFMAETVKVLCPDKKVLCPDLNAGCSLADSCPADAFAEFISRHPGHMVVSYVNTSLPVKALSDILVTSGNALRIVQSIPAGQPVIFGPDKNLGAYLNSVSGREMVLWDGACHVHERFSAEKIAALKALHPHAPVLVHPECRRPVVLLADKVGSTKALLDYVRTSPAKEFIVATESGILHQMQQDCPDKTFIPAPPDDSTCGCNDCNFMKLITLEKLYLTLLHEAPEVTVDTETAERALVPIQRMLSY